MPVGTQASVKGIWSEQLHEIGYRLILGNTYHLSLRPGVDLIANLGGLRKFMNWPHAVLTDSGGYQVFSLAENLKFHFEGVEFQSHIDGGRHMFSSPQVVDAQAKLGSDIFMVLDDCAPANSTIQRLRDSLDRTHRWAQEAILHFQSLKHTKSVISSEKRIFGIIQGGLNETLRGESLEYIQSLPFDGIAIGGLSVGEERVDLYRMLAFLATRLDKTRPHYLMGVGTVTDILEAVRNGIDMFDCVLPTRNARNGQAFTSKGVLRLRNQKHANSQTPLDPDCKCQVCSNMTCAYLRHLFMAGEMLGPMMLTYHNLFFYYDFMSKMREAIQQGCFMDFYKQWMAIYAPL